MPLTTTPTLDLIEALAPRALHEAVVAASLPYETLDKIAQAMRPQRSDYSGPSLAALAAEDEKATSNDQ
jgi:hypothetical protein